MSPLPFGIIASSAGGFVATGGNTIFDANGYRHHIFTASGTLTVAGAGAVKVISQFGGASGGGWSSTSNTATSGAGGSSGITQYYDATVTGNVTVTVGAAASTSSTTGAITPGAITQPAARAGGTSWRATHAGDFCDGFCCDSWGCWCCQFGKMWALNQTATAGAAGAEHSTISSVYSGGFQQLSYTTYAGGGGGAGGLEFYNTNGQWQQAFPTSGNVAGGGAGGGYANGGAAQANTGGGGGGAQAYAYTWGGAGGTSGGLGGSGYVIISYPI